MESAIFDYYANITPQQVDWLWYPYIPYGKITVIQGDPGEGKSTFALNLIALLTRGLPMPDGYMNHTSGIAIYQCAEDGIADTVKPRLEQAGADCGRVAYIIDDHISLTLEDGRIEKTVRETGAQLLVIDPIQAFLSADSDMMSPTKMRSVLRRLAKVAENNRCAVLLVGHMNKGIGGKALYRGLGSIDIAAISRSVLMIARDEEKPDIRYMYQIKSSLAPEGDAIAFTFRKDGGLEWLGKRQPKAPEIDCEVPLKVSKCGLAVSSMTRLLSTGDLPAKEVYTRLAAIGIGSRTVEKVKKELGVITYRSDNSWYWKLP